MTRIDKFIQSFDAFMADFALDRWSITKSNNKHTGAHHDFQLMIPLNYTVQIPHANDEGTIEWREVNKSQIIPAHADFEEKFYEYFGPHGDPIWNRVYMGLYAITETHEYQVEIKMRLSNGKHLPFPTPSNDDVRFNRMEQENERLRSRVEQFTQEIDAVRDFWQMRILHESNLRIKMRRKYINDKKNLMICNARHISRMVHTIGKYYAKEETKENCPVCLEQIAADNLYVPGCCHYLCKSCAKHVLELNNKCPICRDVMYSTSGILCPPNTDFVPFPPPFPLDQEEEAQFIA